MHEILLDKINTSPESVQIVTEIGAFFIVVLLLIGIYKLICKIFLDE